MRRKGSAIIGILFLMTVSCEQKIDSLEDVMINGVNQKILVQGNTEKPLILYLHGGPGYSSILESQCYTNLLKQESLFVQWDQRGTGHSFHENIDTATMSMEQFVEDTRELTDYLLKRFNKKKIYLAGHSWGSALGFYTITKYPEKYHAFIGAGQVISREEHIRTRIEWVRQQMIEANDTTGLKELESNIDANAGFIYKYGGFMHKIVNVDSITKASPYYSAEYANLIEKGAVFSSKYIAQEEQNNIDLTRFSSVRVPVYFFLGKYDWLAPTSYPVNFLEKLQAPYKKVIWFDSAAHLMMMEEPIKFQKELIKIIRQE
jgi:pimeloyl-ACP methyl ester carboxylesterase